ncbi:MAG: MFS transporter, partial [Acidobacteriota bacterium]
MTKLSRIRGYLALEPGIIGLLAMVVLVGMGERMAERFLPLYLMALGGGVWAVGLFNAMDNLLSALYSFPGGYLAERWGTRRSLLLFNLMAGLGFAIVIAVPRWEAVIVGAVFFLSWSAISLPATMSLVARALPQNKRAMGVSMHSLVRRLPMALGPLIGGACVDRWGAVAGLRIAFGGALAMAVAAALLQQLLIEDDRPQRPGPAPLPIAPEKNPLRLLKSMPGELKELLASDILIRSCEQITYPFVVIWCMQIISRPVSGVEFGLLTTLEMATAVAVYIPVAHFADRGRKKPFVLATFAFFALFPLAWMASHSFWALAGAFALRGLKEFGEPTRKSLILDLAP